MNALIIVWRESLEAMLVIGVLLGWIARQPEPAMLRSWLWLGAGAGLALAGALAAATFLVRDQMQGLMLEAFQVGMALVAMALLVQMVFWMRRHGRTIRHDLERRAQRSAGALGLAVVTALAVAREGAETVIFLYGLGLDPDAAVFRLSVAAAAGFVLAAASAWLLARGARFLSYRLLFRISEVLLLLIATSLLASGIDRMIALDWLPPLLDPVWDSSVLLDDTGGIGEILARFLGYRARPCGTLVAAYAVFWSAVMMALWRTQSRVTVKGSA